MDYEGNELVCESKATAIDEHGTEATRGRRGEKMAARPSGKKSPEKRSRAYHGVMTR